MGKIYSVIYIPKNNTEVFFRGITSPLEDFQLELVLKDIKGRHDIVSVTELKEGEYEVVKGESGTVYKEVGD
ncbi:hypothetical protein JARJAR_22 [Bacillus phage vB_BanH_JarJar]|nr:hypothetical protein JARJAR_22 [Bacillus phage vB_BanH_JarJar]UGO50327.1 hypothetical protein RONSWANSON_21 [Bacillus phage vB_BanH_RonSwanson]